MQQAAAPRRKHFMFTEHTKACMILPNTSDLSVSGQTISIRQTACSLVYCPKQLNPDSAIKGQHFRKQAHSKKKCIPLLTDLH